jgi:hypothetical protein
LHVLDCAQFCSQSTMEAAEIVKGEAPEPLANMLLLRENWPIDEAEPLATGPAAFASAACRALSASAACTSAAWRACADLAAASVASSLRFGGLSGFVSISSLCCGGLSGFLGVISRF